MAKCIATSTLGAAPDTYLYSLARIGDIYATIGSDDTLRVFDTSLKLLSKKTRAAADGLSCLCSNNNAFITAGRDGLIRSWDARTARPLLEIAQQRPSPISSIAAHGNFIAAGTESAKEGLGDVSVLLYDTRMPDTPLRNYCESHSDTITQLKFHPTQSNILMSGSTDGLVSFFDTTVADEDDALQRVLNPRSAVHCAGFLSATDVYIATTDEQFSIHSLDDTAERSVVDFGDVRQTLDCSYIVDIVDGGRPVVVCGNLEKKSLALVELANSQSRPFGARIELSGAHGEEVVRDLIITDEGRKAISCGEDGYVKVWAL